MEDGRVWFHCTTHTYGAWLYGDPRGFRTRHHREHVEGDYKNPPPKGKYASQFARSRRLMKQPAVVIPRELRQLVGAAVRDELAELGAWVIALSCGGQHVHLLAKMPGGPVPREWIGRAKRQANFVLKGHGWDGKLWAVRSKVIPVTDRGHQRNTFHYILAHAAEGAWVWSYKDSVPPKAQG
jgi:REP element-mobilizing transposase RayT